MRQPCIRKVTRASRQAREAKEISAGVEAKSITFPKPQKLYFLQQEAENPGASSLKHLLPLKLHGLLNLKRRSLQAKSMEASKLYECCIPPDLRSLKAPKHQVLTKTSKADTPDRSLLTLGSRSRVCLLVPGFIRVKA